MLQFERHNQIMDILKQKRFISVKELSRNFYFSEATVRRDFEKMEQMGLISRVRGGAILNEGPNIEAPLLARQAENKEVKCEIAKKAAQMVKDGDIILLDASSTVLQMVSYLAGKKDLTIITNGLRTMAAVSEQVQCKLYCTGGIMRSNSSSSLVGSHARNFLASVNVGKMFFSVHAVDPIDGLCDLTEDVAELKQVMLLHSTEKILLADSSKFNKTSFCKVCGVDEIDCIVTNQTKALDSEEWQRIQMKVNIACT